MMRFRKQALKPESRKGTIRPYFTLHADGPDQPLSILKG